MYLNELSNNSEVNLMTKQNIAIVFGPTLLRTMNSDAALDFSRTGSLSDIVECMIEYVTDFFDVRFSFIFIYFFINSLSRTMIVITNNK